MFFDIVKDHLVIPIQNGVEALAIKSSILFDSHIFSIRILLSSNTIDPNIIFRQYRLHGLRFIYKTAMIRIGCK